LVCSKLQGWIFFFRKLGHNFCYCSSKKKKSLGKIADAITWKRADWRVIIALCAASGACQGGKEGKPASFIFIRELAFKN
jgi:hypothetical protein